MNRAARQAASRSSRDGCSAAGLNRPAFSGVAIPTPPPDPTGDRDPGPTGARQAPAAFSPPKGGPTR